MLNATNCSSFSIDDRIPLINPTPSTAEQWTRCPFAMIKERISLNSSRFNHFSTAAMKTGTDKHAIAESNLNKYINGQRDTSTLGMYELAVVSQYEQLINDGLPAELFVELAHDFIYERVEEKTIHIHMRIDALVKTNYDAYIFDLKSGRGTIYDIEDNPQLMLYAIGISDKFKTVKRFHIAIVQNGKVKMKTMRKGEIWDYFRDIVNPAINNAATAEEPKHSIGQHCLTCRKYQSRTCPFINSTLENINGFFGTITEKNVGKKAREIVEAGRTVEYIVKSSIHNGVNQCGTNSAKNMMDKAVARYLAQHEWLIPSGYKLIANAVQYHFSDKEKLKVEVKKLTNALPDASIEAMSPTQMCQFFKYLGREDDYRRYIEPLKEADISKSYPVLVPVSKNGKAWNK